MRSLFYSAKGLALVELEALLSLLTYDVSWFTRAVGLQLAACREHRVKPVHGRDTRHSR